LHLKTISVSINLSQKWGGRPAHQKQAGSLFHFEESQRITISVGANSQILGA